MVAKVAKASSMPLRRCETNASEEGKIGDEMQVGLYSFRASSGETRR